jgi:acetoin:2,6-dichlorophenolindophenol oxidoreductase subunit alpha
MIDPTGVATGRNDRHVERLQSHYRMMARIRAFEERAEQGARDGLVKGAIHLSIGQEAVAAGVCAHLRRADLITTTHRGHGHTLAKGADATAMMCELFGRAGGACEGKGGSMHIADFSVGMLGANGVVGAGILIAVGAAHGLSLEAGAAQRDDDRVVVCFFGDGAVNRGPFLEGLNWARIFNLPVLFVCEDNQWSATTHTSDLTGGPGPVARAEALGIRAVSIDGNDIEQVDRTAGELLALCRAGKGPAFLHARTYRLKGHTAADAGAYRKAEEVAARMAVEPLRRCAERLRALGVADQALAAVDEDAAGEMTGAFAAARAAPWPAPDLAFAHVHDVGAGAWR